MEDIAGTERTFKGDIRERMNFAIAGLIPLVVFTVFKISISFSYKLLGKQKDFL